MISSPITGVRRRKSGNRCNPVIVADWLELNAVFLSVRTTISEAVDVFLEDEVYLDSDEAYRDVVEAWNQFDSRTRVAGASYPVKIESGGIEPVGNWEDSLPYAFQLLVSALPWLRAEHEQFKQKEYNEQGKLFEVLSSLAINSFGMSVHRPGWPPDSEAGVEPLVNGVATFLNETPRLEELSIWFSESAKDEELDLVASFPICDSRPAVPVIMLQVASGANWKDKILSPHIDTWREVIGFTTTPLKGFCMPFVLSDSEFRYWCKKGGVMFERLRLASLASTRTSPTLTEWCSEATVWMRPFVEKLRAL